MADDGAARHHRRHGCTGKTAVGATATGKSDVAQRWAARSCSLDSRQVYRGMDIGTAKPVHRRNGRRAAPRVRPGRSGRAVQCRPLRRLARLDRGHPGPRPRAHPGRRDRLLPAGADPPHVRGAALDGAARRRWKLYLAEAWTPTSCALGGALDPRGRCARPTASGWPGSSRWPC
jgi:hypothetical protein